MVTIDAIIPNVLDKMPIHDKKPITVIVITKQIPKNSTSNK